MLIKIPDHLSSKERKKLLKILPISYAFSKFSTQGKNQRRMVESFLGYSRRGLDRILNSYSELKKFKKISNYSSMINFNDKLLRNRIQNLINIGIDYMETKLYRYAEPEEKEILTKIFYDLTSNKVGLCVQQDNHNLQQ